MKFVICTLLFAFLILFNFIELSSQSGYGGSGDPNELISIELPNIPAGQFYIMPNGSAYRSRGTGYILVIYDPHQRRATVHQEGGGSAVTLGPGPYGQRHHREEFPVVRMNPVPQRVPPPPPPSPPHN